jgi:8-oxo-dGTP diphosphatase
MMDVRQVPVVLVAALALFDQSGRILLAKRPEGKAMAGLWELPGGKIEAGEVPEHALCREISEELGLVIAPDHLAPLCFASHAYDSFHLLMPVWQATRFAGVATAREGQGGLMWASGDQLDGLAMPPADLPLIPFLKAHSAAMVMQ